MVRAPDLAISSVRLGGRVMSRHKAEFDAGICKDCGRKVDWQAGYLFTSRGLICACCGLPMRTTNKEKA
jgi:predicted amidophosphoribosyltransferase